MPLVSSEAMWNQELAQLLEGASKEFVWKYISRILINHFNVSGVAIIRYPHDSHPRILFSYAVDKRESERIKAYLLGAYLFDPFYAAMSEKEFSGIYSLNDVAPEGFEESEYFSSFFSFYGLSDELNVIVPIDGSSIAISIGRSANEKPFAEKTRDFLEASYPFLKPLVERTAQEEANGPQAYNHEAMRHFHESLKEALRLLGTSVLSPREKTILDHLLRGYSVKATSERLNITEGTIRLHRHSIYTKLDISSQNELFALVLGSLQNLVLSPSAIDPLVALLPPDIA